MMVQTAGLSWRIVSCALSAALLIISVIAASAPGGASDQPATIELVVVDTSSGTYTFKAEIADTQALRERGLMFRHKLPTDRAMLFDWGHVQVATMWMRNTYIALDMIFIEKDGRVESIVENTEPQSLDIISSQGPVAAVLEVAAGTAQRIGLQPGDKVTHRIFQAN